MNRYKISEKDLKSVLEKLKGKDVPGLPNWFKKNKEALSIKNGKLFFEEKEVIPREKVDATLRDAFYKKDSKVPWARDSGYADISKRFAGISKRAFADFASRQRVKIRTDNVPRKIEKKGRKLSKKGQIELDLYFTSRSDLPTTIQKQYKPSIEKTSPQHYTLTMIDKLTSLTFLSHIGTGKGSKSRKSVMAHVREGQKFFAERLGVPIAKQKYIRDDGGEFDPALPGYVLKLGPAVEARNSFAQRVVHRLLAAKRGDLKSVTKQAMEILNNTKSKISKKTPNEAAAAEQSELAPKYNAARTAKKPTHEKKLKVGDMVRLVTKDKKDRMYKAYKGTQFSSEKFPITKVGNKLPYRYFVDGSWFYRDQISNKENPIDKVSEARLAKLTATGKVKAIPKPKEKKKKEEPSPQKIRRSARLKPKEKPAKPAPKPKAPKDKLTADQKELKRLHRYVTIEERKYPTYDNLPVAEQERRLATWNKNIARAKALVKKGVTVKGVAKNFFK